MSPLPNIVGIRSPRGPHLPDPFSSGGPGVAVSIGGVSAIRQPVNRGVIGDVVEMNDRMDLENRGRGFLRYHVPDAIRVASFKVAPDELARLRANPDELKSFLAAVSGEAMQTDAQGAPTRRFPPTWLEANGKVDPTKVNVWPKLDAKGHGAWAYRPVYDTLKEQLGHGYYEDNPRIRYPDYPNLSGRLHHVLGSMMQGASAYQVQWMSRSGEPHQAMLAMVTINDRTGEVSVLGRYWPK
jgi:hypothetical protein